MLNLSILVKQGREKLGKKTVKTSAGHFFFKFMYKNWSSKEKMHRMSSLHAHVSSICLSSNTTLEVMAWYFPKFKKEKSHVINYANIATLPLPTSIFQVLSSFCSYVHVFLSKNCLGIIVELHLVQVYKNKIVSVLGYLQQRD